VHTDALYTKPSREETMHRILFTAIVFVGACNGDADDLLDGPCQQYCERRNECDSDVEVEPCRQDCVDAAQDCQSDEKEQALDDIEACSEEDCNEIAQCTIGASLQCYLGI
jgi:hypothetical protein